MAKLIYNGQEIADVTYTSGGGGGSGLPTFTETVIATGTSGGTVTFTEDYHDYDLLIIRCTNASSGNVTDLLSSSDMLDAILDPINEIVVNEMGNNNYGTYRKDNVTTWSRVGARNLYISEIIGLTCDNMTVTETEIYNKGSYDTQSRTISGTDLLDYDLFVIASSVDGVQPNSIITQKPLVVVDYKYLILVTPYSRNQLVTITNTGMSSAPYHYVGGIKFT